MKTYSRGIRVDRNEPLPAQDDTRATFASHERHSCMLNTCRECKTYKYVYCHIDLGDGKGPGYVCGRCVREAKVKRPA